MTFTYTPSASPDNVTLVRFYTRDTDSTAALNSDEEINMMLSVKGGVGPAIVAIIKSAIAALAQEPDMSADWLKIDWRRSSEEWQLLLTEARREFGLGPQIDSGGRHAYRPDTLQKSPPDYGET